MYMYKTFKNLIKNVHANTQCPAALPHHLYAYRAKWTFPLLSPNATSSAPAGWVVGDDADARRRAPKAQQLTQPTAKYSAATTSLEEDPSTIINASVRPIPPPPPIAMK